jgi:ADP-heptose:LPS heptosyltransferase
MLRRALPSARIRWLINSEWMPLLQGNPDVDEIVEFPRRDLRGAAGLLRIAPWARGVRQRVQPDLILDSRGLLRSALISRLCRRKGARVVGLSDAREGSRLFYDRVVDTSACVHAVDRYVALTRAVVGETLPIQWHLPAGEMPREFPANESFTVLHPFSRGDGKSLSLDQVAEFCGRLAPSRVVIVGRAAESLAPIPNAIDLLNQTTLLELIWLLRHARFTVSVDSGPMHIAAALNNRLVSIHTWSDPAKVGPYCGERGHGRMANSSRKRSRDNPLGWRDVPDIIALADFVKTQT